MDRVIDQLPLAPYSPPPVPCPIDDFDLGQFTGVAAGFGDRRYGYVVTPNADHVLRLHDDPKFRSLYASAAYVLLDSRLIAHLLRLFRGVRLPVCTGSDLVASLFTKVIAPNDKLVLIGGTAEQAQKLRERFGLTDLAHFNPPMGFIRDRAAVEECLEFIEAHSPFRFCLLAVGSPQQEIVAQKLRERRAAHGMALCVGASVNFLTGEEKRAPQWMRKCGLEWLYRLLQSPRRLASRYLVRGPRIFGLLGRTQFLLRPASNDAAYLRERRSYLDQPGTSRPSSSKRYAPSTQPLPKRINA
ncbi:MAG TPA: WecB/TagA/CpsF family glycosyltransferase [Nevskiaceae bacterium]|nr:WecB/TagA/CpsF family glycosyltransferase [Nevskiaceae bacterium]